MEEKTIEPQTSLYEAPFKGSWILSQPYNDLMLQTLPFCYLSINWQSQKYCDIWWSFYQVYQQLHFLAVMRLLNVFKSHDHARPALQAVSCMVHHINLLLIAGQSTTDMVQSFKTRPLVWDSGALHRQFGIWHWC